MNLEPVSEVIPELELLATFVEVYESNVYPMPEVDPVDAIRFRMERQGA